MSQASPTSPRAAERKQEKIMLRDLNDRFEKVLNEVRVANFHLGKEADSLTFEADSFAALHLLRNGQTDTLKARLVTEQRDIAKLSEQRSVQDKKVKDKEAETLKADKEGEGRLAKIKVEIRDVSGKVVEKELEIEQLRYTLKKMRDRHACLEINIGNFVSKKREFDGSTFLATKEYDELQNAINGVKADNARIEDALAHYKNEEYYTSFEKEFYRKLDLFEAEQGRAFEEALEIERQRLHAEYNRKNLEIKPEKDREAEISEKLRLKQSLEEKIAIYSKTIATLRFDTKQLKQAIEEKGKDILRLLKDLYKKDYKEINEIMINSELSVTEKSLETEYLSLDAEIYDESVQHAQIRSEKQAELDRLLELERQMQMNSQCDVPLTAELREYEVMLRKMEDIRKAPKGIYQQTSVHFSETRATSAGPSHVSITSPVVTLAPATATPEKGSNAAAAHSPELIQKPKGGAGHKRKHTDTPRP